MLGVKMKLSPSDNSRPIPPWLPPGVTALRSLGARAAPVVGGTNSQYFRPIPQSSWTFDDGSDGRRSK